MSRPVPDGLEETSVRRAHRDSGGITLSVRHVDSKARLIELGNENGDTVTYHWRTSGKRIRLFSLVEDPFAVRPPDVGEKPVAIGSEEWALSWRSEMQYIASKIPEPFVKFSQYWAIGEEHEVWRLLNKPDGSYFQSFDEFVVTKEPWGLGATPDEVEKWLGVARFEEILELARGMDPEELVALAAQIEEMAEAT